MIFHVKENYYNMSNKRLLKELTSLYLQQSGRPLLENNYLIYFDDANINLVHAILKPPADSVYKHKFIRLDIKIPNEYPHSPPDVTFVNHDNVRIHPNMYENGKCCSTILNTWGDDKFEKWTSSMGIETILVTFHSFLDNHPYTYEPGGRDDQSYTDYVEYQTWMTCLIRYLQFEKISLFQTFIKNYMLANIETIINDLSLLAARYPHGDYYSRCFEIDDYIMNYERVIDILQDYYSYIDYSDSMEECNKVPLEFIDFLNTDYKCNICYDTNTDDSSYVTIHCCHSFHTNCLRQHITSNQSLCPMCRTELTIEDSALLNVTTSSQQWMINPQTRRRIKIGGRTYMYLVEQGLI